MNKLYLACMCTMMVGTFPVPRVGADGGDFQRDFADGAPSKTWLNS